MNKYLAINPGSASKKYALYENGREIFAAHLEKEKGGYVATLRLRARERRVKISARDYRDSAKIIVRYIRADGLLGDIGEIKSLGFRLVAPGNFFQKTRLIDGICMQKLKAAEKMAPLHIGAAVAEISAFSKLFPSASLVGVSDSAFHSTLPAQARLYGLPLSDSRRFGLYRFGYHGISAQSVLRTLREMTGRLPARIIVCHLGSGASVTAVKNGRSFDTSMGFTPLEGLLMATRSGDIDAGVLMYLMKRLKMTPDNLDDYLNHRSGLQGIGGTEDVRELLRREEKSENARQALAMFVYRIQKYIGAYTAALGGLDALVFTAAIGERSFIIRERVCRGVGALGVKLDNRRNRKAFERSTFIQSRLSKIKIAVVKTDEMREIAREMSRFRSSRSAPSI